MNNFLLIGDACENLRPFIKIVKKGILPIFRVIIPIALILFGTVDLGKAVIASEETEIKEAQSKLIKRFIYAALVFLMVTLVTLVMDLVAQGADGTNMWLDCWDTV